VNIEITENQAVWCLVQIVQCLVRDASDPSMKKYAAKRRSELEPMVWAILEQEAFTNDHSKDGWLTATRDEARDMLASVGIFKPSEPCPFTPGIRHQVPRA
jgi:hypothetical protein